MSLSMSSLSVPVFQRTFNAMLGVLDKAEAHAVQRQFDPDKYLALRLAPDMLPFGSQIHIASDMAKGCVSRLAGVDVPKWADDETTLPAFRQRIHKTLDYVQGFGPAQLDAGATREIVLKLRSGEMRMSGEDYLKGFVLPNLYFHATMVYALLRAAGVELGKRDFLGA